MGRPVKKGSTDQSTVIRILDSTTFLPETGVTYETAGIDLWYRREKEAKTSITEATLAAVDSAHSDGGIIHIGDGYYRLDPPDAAWATGSGENEVVFGGTVTGMVVIGNSHPLVDYDPYDAVRMGITAIPAAAPGANGGLPTTNGTKINQTVDLVAGQIPTADAIGTDAASKVLATPAQKLVTDANGYVTYSNTAPPSAASIADAVWDEALSGHAGAGTAGNALATASSGGVDPSVLADAIWDEALSGHSTAGTTGKKLTDLTNADLSGVATASQIGTAGAALTAIPWNASWDAEVQSECTDALNAYDPPTKAEVDTACGAVTLKNGAHGGAAATVTLKSVVVDNSEGDAVNFKSTAANKMALKLEGAGTGNSHALYLNSTNGSAIAGASGSHGVSITSSAGHGMVIAGATGDIVADITGDLSGAVGSVTTAVDINSNADITAILQDTGTTLDGKINTLDTVVDLIEDIVRNKMEVVEATGAATLYADDSTTPLLTNTVTSAGGTTTRTRLA